MYDLNTIQALNERKYAEAVDKANQKPADVGEPVRVEEGLIYVGEGYDRDSSVLYISGGEDSYYINHCAGVQRWHKYGCERVEALGYAKQAGVTRAQFKQAFPWTVEGEVDPLDDISNRVGHVTCDRCGEEVELSDSVFNGEDLRSYCTSCDDERIYCEECGNYYFPEEYDRDSDVCTWCKEG